MVIGGQRRCTAGWMSRCTAGKMSRCTAGWMSRCTAGWMSPGSNWKYAENLTPTRIPSTDCSQ